jgi:glycine/D-amino acid oxidase-like deaminating enzyme
LPHAIGIGGGIAGLASAASLLRAGWAVTVLERAGEFTDMGAGIAITWELPLGSNGRCQGAFVPTRSDRLDRSTNWASPAHKQRTWPAERCDLEPDRSVIVPRHDKRLLTPFRMIRQRAVGEAVT